MARGDLDLVARMFECWEAGDLRGLVDCADPGLEWRAASDGELYVGHDGVRELFARRHAEEERLEVPLQRLREVGPGRVLAVGRLRTMRPGRGLADSPGIWAFRMSGGKVTRIEAHASERAALAALRNATPVEFG